MWPGSRFYWWSMDPGSVTSVTMRKDAVNESQTSVCSLKDQRKQSDSLIGPSMGSTEQWKMSMKTVTHGRNTPVTIFKFILRTTVYIIWAQDLQKGTPVYLSQRTASPITDLGHFTFVPEKELHGEYFWVWHTIYHISCYEYIYIYTLIYTVTNFNRIVCVTIGRYIQLQSICDLVLNSLQYPGEVWFTMAKVDRVQCSILY